jgi:hypothetical protein
MQATEMDMTEEAPPLHARAGPHRCMNRRRMNRRSTKPETQVRETTTKTKAAGASAGDHRGRAGVMRAR